MIFALFYHTSFSAAADCTFWIDQGSKVPTGVAGVSCKVVEEVRMEKDVTFSLHLSEDDTETIAHAVLNLRGDHFETMGKAAAIPRMLLCRWLARS